MFLASQFICNFHRNKSISRIIFVIESFNLYYRPKNTTSIITDVFYRQMVLLKTIVKCYLCIPYLLVRSNKQCGVLSQMQLTHKIAIRQLPRAKSKFRYVKVIYRYVPRILVPRIQRTQQQYFIFRVKRRT